MRALCLAILVVAVLACASKPEPDRTSSPPPSAGSVAHVNDESGMVVIRTAVPFAPGDLLRLEGEGGATAVVRVGSWRNGMLAGLVESGLPTEGPCILTPMPAE